MQLKQLGVTLALAGMLSTQAYAHEAVTEAAPLAAAAAQAAPANVLTQDDLVALFGAQEAGKPLQLALLSEQEMRETEGAWGVWGALGGAGIGAWNYLGTAAGSGRFTWSGLAYHVGTGALIGAATGPMGIRTYYMSSRLGYVAGVGSGYGSRRGWW